MNTKKQKSKEYFIGVGSGNSMKPVINEGDRLYIKKTTLKDLQIGDIIIFYDQKNFIGHRLIKKKANYIVTKGDNTPYYDKPLKFTEVLGTVVKIEGKNHFFISTETVSWNIIKYFFLVYSLFSYYAVQITSRLVSIIFFWRFILTKWLIKK